MERRAGMTLVNRTTRRMMLTPEGDVYLDYARRILDQMDELGELLGSAKQRPKGLLRVNATLGFGRSHVGPAISHFVARRLALNRRLLVRGARVSRAARHATRKPCGSTAT